MAGTTFSFEDVMGPDDQDKDDGFILKPASRTSKPSSGVRSFDASAGGDNPDFNTFRSMAAAFPGTQITSLLRSPKKNREVGGKINSQHLTGTAGDFVVPDEHKPAFMADAKARGYVAIDEGDHIHLQRPKGRRVKHVGAIASEPEVTKTSFSFDEIVGEAPEGPIPQAPKPDAVAPKQQPGIQLPKAVRSFMQDPDVRNALFEYSTPRMFEAAKTAATKSFEFVMNRVLSDMGQIAPDDPNYRPGKGQYDPFAGERDIRARTAEREAAAEQSERKGFFGSIRNPIELLTQDGLPANFVEMINNAPRRERESFWNARKVMMQENIVANPHNYPAVAVEAARNAIKQREAKQDPTVRSMWADLKKAASEDPGKFGAVLANAIVADPYMLLAPEGLGARVIQGTRTVAGLPAATGKIVQMADKAIDAGSTGAALNLGMEAVAAGSEGRTMTSTEVATSAALGFVLSAGASTVFGKGAQAVRDFKANNVSADTVEQILKDVAAEDIEAEAVASSTGPIAKNVKHRIEEVTGVKFESDQDLRDYLNTTRKEWRQLFKDRDLNGQYQAALAQERMDRAAQLKAEAEQRTTDKASQAEAQRARDIEAAYDEVASARAQRLDDEWKAALAARDAADVEGDQVAAIREDQLRYITGQVNQQEIVASALEGDLPQVKRAMAKALARDAHLARPKWQRGEVDPKLLARLGVGGVFAGTAFAVAPEDAKVKTALAAGLAGLLVPGGGSVLSKMRQAGMISPEGDIIGLLVKQGKMLPTEDAAQFKMRQVQQIKAAAAGDQAAYRDLYNEEFPRVQRAVTKMLRNTGGRLGIDPDDIAQEVMIDAFKGLDKFDPERASFSTWLHAIARNRTIKEIRDTNRAGAYNTQSMYGKLDDDGEFMEDISPEVETAARDIDTPEANAIREQAALSIKEAIESLPEEDRLAYLLQNVELYDTAKIGEMMGWTPEQTRKRLSRADEKVQEKIAKSWRAVPAATSAAQDVSSVRAAVGEATAGELPVKRGRGRPPGTGKNQQRGSVDPKILKTMAVVGLGAGVAGFTTDEDKDWVVRAIGGAGLGLLLFGGGKTLVKGADNILGASSTRIMNKSRTIHRRILTTERKILEQTHRHISKVDPFLVRLSKLPKETQEAVSRVLMTGHAGAIDRLFKAINDPELTAGYKSVRSSLDELGDRLVNLARFKRTGIEYFPRIVTDKEGLFKAIGKVESDKVKEALVEANGKSLRERGRPLGEIEESALINKMLFADKRAVQPGFTKNRGIEEITPELQKFYASPAESLHSYIRAAVQDIEAADFFGTAARNMKRGQFEYLDVQQSVNNLIAQEVSSGKLTNDDAAEIATLLKARFNEGLRGEHDLIRNFKNLGNIGLLGNLWSAGTQLADVGVQVYTQDLRSAVSAVVRQITRRKIVDMKDFGLADHISEEFAGQLRTSRWVNKVFKGSLFAGIDAFGKNTALNAAIIRAQRLAQSPSGQAKLANKYQDAFGAEFPQLVSDLKAGKITERTRDYAFMELSRTQPISRIEMPEAYLKHPNARSYLWLKSFMIKQFDVVRRDAYNEIKAGNRARGIKNLMEFGVVLGISGATTEAVKDWMLGRDVRLEASDVYLNAFKTFGMSKYFMDEFAGVSAEEAAARREAGDKFARKQDAAPLQAIGKSFIPPYKMFESILNGDPSAWRYLVPGVGPYVAEQVKKADAMEKEIENE